MNDTKPIISKLNEINIMINEAQINLGQGNITNLSHLDAEVSQICDEILQLPPNEAKKAQPILADMIGNLDTLTTSLKTFQTQLKEQVK